MNLMIIGMPLFYHEKSSLALWANTNNKNIWHLTH